jgi:hypothetical protein
MSLTRVVAEEATPPTDAATVAREPDPLPRLVAAVCAVDKLDFRASTWGFHWAVAADERLSTSLLIADRLASIWLTAPVEMLILPREATDERSALASEHTAAAADALLLGAALLVAGLLLDPLPLDPQAATRQHAAASSPHPVNLGIAIRPQLRFNS